MRIFKSLFNKKLLVLTCCSFLFLQSICADDIYKAYRAQWLEKAELYKPELISTCKKPLEIVELINDPDAFQGWRTIPLNLMDSLYEACFKDKSGIVIDFGEHMTGYVSFVLNSVNRIPDAPIRLRLTFGEVPSEVMTPFDPYPGTLSRAWLQDEIVTVMTIPDTITISRRVAFRYLKIELMNSVNYDFTISSISCNAVTSASQFPSPLSSDVPQIVQDIDKAALNTLKECMQTVFEDGPKRDQRLWIGDLYLQSMTNNYSFKQYDLTKRCLYLFAALSQEDGFLYSNVFERPKPHPHLGEIIYDYALLYNVTVKDYLEASGDRETALDLWPVVKKQLDFVRSYVKEDYLLDYDRADKDWWLFFDWRGGLHKEVALHGISVYAMKQTYELARMLNKEDEVKDIPELIKKMSKAAYKYYYDKDSGLFIGTLDDQKSYQSQVWMVLAGIPNQKDAQRALRTIVNEKDALEPATPYMYHYYIQALIDCGMLEEAKASLESYWGGMIQKGADTFWEAYDPKDDFLSYPNFFPINSYCHAWSCTPVYFIRKYPKIFQR